MVSKIIFIVKGMFGFTLFIPLMFCMLVSQVISEIRMTGEDVFQSCVHETIPESVEILDFQANLIGMDDSYWIHFTIASEDVPTVIQNSSYEYSFIEIASEDWKRDFIAIYPPEWWDVETMSEDGEFYECSNTHHEYFCNMFVNENNDKVYFVYGTI